MFEQNCRHSGRHAGIYPTPLQMFPGYAQENCVSSPTAKTTVILRGSVMLLCIVKHQLWRQGFRSTLA